MGRSLICHGLLLDVDEANSYLLDASGELSQEPSVDFLDRLATAEAYMAKAVFRRTSSFPCCVIAPTAVW